MLEHTKMNQAKQRARIVLLGRTIQNKEKHLYPVVNHVKKVLSAHQRQTLIKNAVLEHTKMNQAKERARIATPGNLQRKKASHHVPNAAKVQKALQEVQIALRVLQIHTRLTRYIVYLAREAKFQCLERVNVLI